MLSRSASARKLLGDSKPTVAIFENREAMMGHVPPKKGWASEEPRRILAIEMALKGHPVRPTIPTSAPSGGFDVREGSLWASCVVRHVNGRISDAEIAREYGPAFLKNLLVKGGVEGLGPKNSYIDPECGDIYWSHGTLTAARTAAAAAIEAVQYSLFARNHSFCVVRPPGHHCFDVPAGFCILNNVALAARSAIRSGKRVAIVDWDYHFGDGTAEALLLESAATFVSLHAATTGGGLPTYPANDAADIKGAGLAEMTEGRCFNIQWDTDDADDAAYAYAMRHAVLPALARFKPDIVLISAGYDAARGDALAGMDLSVAAFRYMAQALTGLGVPVVGVLEGGYTPALLAECVVETIHGLRGETTATDLETWMRAEPAASHKTVVDAVVAALDLCTSQ